MQSPWQRHPASGFTLIEVLVTLAIMSMIMMGLHVALHSTIYSHDDMAIDIAQIREGPRILDLMERDLRSLHCYNIKDNTVLKGELDRHSTGARGDRIDFLTGIDSATRLNDPLADQDEPRRMATDVVEVGYRLRSNPEHDDFLELYRREDLFIDDKPMEGGRYELLHDRVQKLEITYLDRLGEEAEEVEEWDSEENDGLPAAVLVKLEVQSQPNLIGDYVDSVAMANSVFHFQRVIPLSPQFRETMRIRPAMPTVIDPNAPDPNAPQTGGTGNINQNGGGGDGLLGGIGGGVGGIGGGAGPLTGGAGGGDLTGGGGLGPGGGGGGGGRRGGGGGPGFGGAPGAPPNINVGGAVEGALNGEIEVAPIDLGELENLLNNYGDSYGNG